MRYQLSKTHAILLLLLACAIWGFAFPAVDYALQFFSVFSILFLRSLIAVLALGAYLLAKKSQFTTEDWRAGIIAGVVLFVAYSLQTFGQTLIAPTSSAFVTGLYVLFVPLLSALFLAKLPSRRIMLAAMVAFLGLFMLSGAKFDPGLGEEVTVLCALIYGGYILLLYKFRAQDSVRLVFVQMLVGAALSGAAMLLTGQGTISLMPVPLLVVGYLGILSGAFAYWAQARAQQVLQASEAAIFSLSEPVFAGIFSVLFFADILSPVQILGAGLILVGMYAASKK